MSFANYKGEILDISDNFSVPFFTVYFIFSVFKDYKLYPLPK